MRNFIEKQLGMSVEGLINVIISEKCGYIDGMGSAPTLLDISGSVVGIYIDYSMLTLSNLRGSPVTSKIVWR